MNEIEGIFPPGLVNGDKTDGRIENLSRQGSLGTLLQISPGENQVTAGIHCHHKFSVVLHGRNASLPC